MDFIDQILFENIKSNDEDRGSLSESSLILSLQSNKGKGKSREIKVPSIDEIERNVLSEYTIDENKRREIRTTAGRIGGFLSGLAGIYLRKLIRNVGGLAAFPVVLFGVPSLVLFGYLLGHQLGATYVNTFYRRRKKPIVVGYDDEGNPIEVEVFAPKDLKSKHFYNTMLGGE